MRLPPSFMRCAVGLSLLATAPMQARAADAAAATAAPAKEPRTILAIPFAPTQDAQDWMGVAIAEALNDSVVQDNNDNFLTLKQLDAVLRRRNERLNDPRIPAQAIELARAVGATDLLAGSVSLKGDEAKLEGKLIHIATGGETKTASVDGPKSQLPRLAFELGEKLLGANKAGPMTKSAKAMEMLAKCEVDLDRQSVGPRAHIVLVGERLAQADELCQGALAADSKLGLAHAYEAVLLSLHDKNVDARKEAALSQTFKRYVPMGTLADAFAARRAGDANAARAVLETAVHEHPGFLHAIGYLAEEQEDLNQNQAAYDWWSQYLARAPGHPFATARAGRALARLGKAPEGIALTKKALERSPNDPELLIELASRHIDAGEMDRAEAILLDVEKVSPSRPLAWLRLGYLDMKQNKLPQARDQFLSAIKQASGDDEARWRAVAYSDLAELAAQQGQFDAAIENLKQAAKEGMHKLPCDTPELAKFKGKPQFDRVCSDAAANPGGLVDDEDVVGVDVVQ